DPCGGSDPSHRAPREQGLWFAGWRVSLAAQAGAISGRATSWLCSGAESSAWSAARPGACGLGGGGMKERSVPERDIDMQARLWCAGPATACPARAVSHLRRMVLVVLLAAASAGIGDANAQQPSTEGQFDCLIQPKMVLKLGTPVTGLLSEV